MKKNIAYIELGGNKGDRLNLLIRAKKTLQDIGCKLIQESSIYETPPWGFEADQNFYNQIVKIETFYNALELIQKLQNIEKELGRVRGAKRYESRTIDLDILFFNREILNNETLIIPHPRLHLRNFVLIPMNEIAPDLIHPVLNLTINELLLSCEDNSTCFKLPE